MFHFNVVWTVLFVASMRGVLGTAPINSIPMKIVNNAGLPIELFWINTFTPERELVKQTDTPLKNGSDVVINSYNTHQFSVKFLDPKLTSSAHFKKGPFDETITITYNASHGMTVRQVTEYDEYQATVNAALKKCQSRPSADQATCVGKLLFKDTERLQKQIKDTNYFLTKSAGRVRNYTCIDEDMDTSEPVSSARETILGRDVTVDTLLEMDAAKIWAVYDFISEEECEVLREFASPRLRRATVAGTNGMATVSNNRRAQQAGYTISGESDPLWSLYQRVFKFTNDHTGYDLDTPGQEDFTVIQYNISDEYTPHCDGACDGEKHNPRGRVATAVLYCEVPPRGGATTFAKADIFIRPQPGMATFFSYMGSDGRMDTGFTEHSGCPVLEGEKWITTVWMRKGVDAVNNWMLFEPSGERLPQEVLDAEENEEYDIEGNDEF